MNTPEKNTKTAVDQITSNTGVGRETWIEFLAGITSEAIYHCAYLAEVYECTPDGQREINVTGGLICTPLGVQNLAISCMTSSERIQSVILSIMDTAADDVQSISSFCDSRLFSAIDFVKDFNSRKYENPHFSNFLADINSNS